MAVYTCSAAPSYYTCGSDTKAYAIGYGDFRGDHTMRRVYIKKGVIEGMNITGDAMNLAITTPPSPDQRGTDVTDPCNVGKSYWTLVP